MHRIWSTDWWQQPERELKKLEDALRTALATKPSEAAPAPALPAGEPPPTARPSTAASPIPYVVSPAPPARAAEPAPRLARAPEPAAPAPVTLAIASGPAAGVPYRIFEVAAGRRAPDELHEDRHGAELRALLASIAGVEAPISLTVLARRIAPFYGIQRTTQRVVTRVQALLGHPLKLAGQIVWRNDQHPPAYAGFRIATAEARRDATDIAVEEIANAAAYALHVNVALAHDELVKQTARALGFARTGERVAECMASGIALLVEQGRARRDGDRIAAVEVRS